MGLYSLSTVRFSGWQGSSPMNHKTQLAYYALWFTHPVLQLSVAAVMCWRKQRRAFPLFFTYILSQIVIFSVLLPIYRLGDSPLYFYGYWVCAGISLTLGFMVIHEIFLDVFRPYHTLRDLGSVLFKWAALVMLLVAGVVAAASAAAVQGSEIQALGTVQRGLGGIQGRLILFLPVFSNLLGVSWRRHRFCIALGF